MPEALTYWNEAERLEALRSYEILDTASEAAFDNLTQLAARLTGCPVGIVSLVDENRQWFKSRHGIDATETPRGVAFCAHAILDPEHALVVADATADARFADNPLVTGDPGIRFYAAVPLVNPEGYALGTLCVIDHVPKQIDRQDLEALSRLADAVMSALELRRATAQLKLITRRMNDHFSRIIEAIPSALVLCDGAGKIRIINSKTEQMLGYSRAELDGQPIEWLLPERFQSGHMVLFQGFIRHMSSRSMGEGQTVFGRRRDGSEFPVEVGLSPIDLGGEPMAVAVIVDVTQRHRLELEREQQRLELERSNGDLQDFAHAASHDLKAPLRAIGHLAEWMQDDVAAVCKKETIEQMGLLQGRVRRMQMLLDGLLAYSRVGRSKSRAQPVDIAEQVREIGVMLAPPPGFEVVCEGEMFTIRTHLAPMQMVLKNLIGNAIQHHDRADGRVSVSMRWAGELVEFRVADDGPGIPERYQTKIFTIFETLKPRDSKETSGIGLAMVKKQVRNNGGSILVHSHPPARGATFVFTWRIETPGTTGD